MNVKSSIALAFRDAFSPAIKKAQGSLDGMKSALDDFHKNKALAELAVDMAMATDMTEPLRRALSNALDQPARIAATMDSAFKNIQVAVGTTNEEMAGMRQELLAIGRNATAGPEAVANAYADIAGGIADASKRMSIMSAAVALAEANQADLGTSTNALITIMNAWNLSADKASLAADALTQASFAGAGSLDDFAGAIRHLSPLAARAGIWLDELGAALAFATTKGIGAAQAQKQFEGIISTLMRPSETLAGLYASLGIQSGQAMLRQYGLAESLVILKDALGGGEEAFAALIGSAEEATAALALTENAYVDFAGSFAEGMGSVTEAARAVQLESIEAKMKRLDSASGAVQARIGQDVNTFKGFFADIKTSFLADLVGPFLDTSVGGVFSKLAAGAGMLAKGVIDVGSGALNTASQIVTLSSCIKQADGLLQMFKSSCGLLTGGFKFLTAPIRLVVKGISGFGKSIIGALPAMSGYIASMWAAVAPTLAATWPILAIIAAVAALAAGVYLIIKNWDKIAAFFKKLWEDVKVIFTSVWDAIKNFFTKIWDKLKTPIGVFVGFFKGIWEKVTGAFKTAWKSVKDFFTDIWDGMKSIINGVADFLGLGPINPFDKAEIADDPLGVAEMMTSLLVEAGDISKEAGRELMKNFAAGIESGAPMTHGAIMDAVQDIARKLPHSDAEEGPLSTLTASGSALMDTFAVGIQNNAAAAADAFGGAIQDVANQMPHSDAKTGPLSELTSSGRALTDTFASGMDDGALRDKANLVFSAAAPQGEKVAFPSSGDAKPKAAGSQTIHIQNLYLQADECQTIFDFVKMIMHTVDQPGRAPI